MELIYCAARYGGVFVHELHSGAPVMRFRDSNTQGRAFGIVGDDSSVMVASQVQKGLMHFWHVGKEQPSYRAALPEKITAFAFSSDGALLFAGGQSGKVYIWQFATGLLLRCIEAHYKPITHIVMAEDDSLFVTASEDALVNVYVVASALEQQHPQPLHTLSGHGLPVTGVALSAGGIHATVVTGSTDRSVREWELSSGQQRRDFVLPSAVNAVAVSCDGKIFAACANCKVYECTAGSEAEFAGHTGPVTSVAVSDDGTMVVSSSQVDGVRIWDVATRACLRQLHQCFQNAHISGVKLGHRTACPAPLPEFKPLQRMVAEKAEGAPVAVRRQKAAEVAFPDLSELLEHGGLEQLKLRKEFISLKQENKSFAEERKRWEAATGKLAAAVIEATDEAEEPMSDALDQLVIPPKKRTRAQV